MNITKQLKLIDFAQCVLARLENDEEWSGDTMKDLGILAYEMDLAETGEDGLFRAKEDFTS